MAANAKGVFQGVVRLALIPTNIGTALHIGIEQPVDDEQRTLYVPDFPERQGKFIEDAWTIYAFMALYALTDAFSLTLVGTLWPDIYGTRFLGSIRGMVSAVFTLATAVGPGVLGYLIDVGIGLDQQLLWSGVYCLLMLPIFMTTARHPLARKL
ncbi:hypothetical protein GCM10007385_01110 [Tateyamaria omphalii]|nr:hypothetical protein GCM10007385_01110 [Tateyamaria omphalii]